MSRTVVINGSNYTVPDPRDTGWGQNVTDLLVALATATIGASPLFFNEVSVSTTPVSVVSGRTYLVNTTVARTLNLPAPAINAYFLVKDVTGSAATNNITLHRNGSESIDGVASDKVISVNKGGLLVMSDGTNWFCLSQFAPALTASRAMATDANGNPSVSSVTATELGYVSGVTSAIQTQITAAAFPSGTKMPFYQASAPTGWTAVAVNDKFLRVVTAGGTGGTTGGTVAASTSLAHTHTVTNHTHSSPAHSHATDFFTASSGDATTMFVNQFPASAGSVSRSLYSITHGGGSGPSSVFPMATQTDGSGTTGGATPGTDSQLGAFAYADIIIASKD